MHIFAVSSTKTLETYHNIDRKLTILVVASVRSLSLSPKDRTTETKRRHDQSNTNPHPPTTPRQTPISRPSHLIPSNTPIEFPPFPPIQPTTIPPTNPTTQTQLNPTNPSLPGSREQNYRPEDCSVCHSGLVGKKGHGFWEGGKGTRDKSRMSRKDPRKFKRAPGGAAKREKEKKKG